jgi:hypothetical protein
MTAHCFIDLDGTLVTKSCWYLTIVPCAIILRPLLTIQLISRYFRGQDPDPATCFLPLLGSLMPHMWWLSQLARIIFRWGIYPSIVQEVQRIHEDPAYIHVEVVTGNWEPLIRPFVEQDLGLVLGRATQVQDHLANIGIRKLDYIRTRISPGDTFAAYGDTLGDLDMLTAATTRTVVLTKGGVCALCRAGLEDHRHCRPSTC